VAEVWTNTAAGVAELAAREEGNRRTRREERKRGPENSKIDRAGRRKKTMPNLEQHLAHVMMQIRSIERLLRGPTDEERQQMQEQLKELEAERERILQQLMDGHTELPKARKRDRERERERERERKKAQAREAAGDASQPSDT
jgi:hypothetical protein